MKTRLEGLTKNRLKRSSFVHESKKLSRQFHDRLPQSTLPFFPSDMPEPWVSDITDIKVHTTVPSLSNGDTQDDTVKQSLTLAKIAERYPQEAWIHVIIIIINLIYIAQFDTNGILTALYIVITYIQMQYVHLCTYAEQSYKYTYTCLHIHTYTVTCTNIHLPTY